MESMNPAFKTVIILVVLYLLYALLLFIFQRWLIYPGQFIKQNPQPSYVVRGITGIRRIWLNTGQNGKTEAWYRAPEEKDTLALPLVIFAHGNYELIDDNLEVMLALNKMGCAVLSVEYPGYGRSQGKPSKETIVGTFLAAYDRIKNELENTPQRIIGYGRSLGGGAVCALAQQRHLDALILQSTFARLRDFTAGYFVPPFLLRDDFDNLQIVKNFRGPMLLLHGRKDEVIPFSQGKRLAGINPSARFVATSYGHNDFPFPFENIRNFLQENGLLSTR